MSPLVDPPTASSLPSDLEAPRPLFQRDSNGLVVGCEYRYTADNRIDWKAMLRSEDLYVKREFRDEVVREYGKPLNELDLTTVKDRYLCVLIGGINRLAHLRGIRAITYPHIHITEGKAVAVCEIEFIGNFETDGLPIIVSAMASATVRSVDADFVPYLETFAENRSRARCIKQALQINILSDIEVGGESKKKIGSVDSTTRDEDVTTAPPSGNEGYHLLAEKCANPPAPLKPMTFAEVREGAIRYATELITDPTQWTGFESIPPADAWNLLGKIEEKAKVAGTTASGKASKGKK